ncbi:MAG: filamentous hemagglutinin N-terminal domain-containing protein, partial [Lautropia sp.]
MNAATAGGATTTGAGLRPGLCALLLALAAPVAQAQVTLDGTVGPQLTLTGPDFQIPATLGTTRGANLFHSFGTLNLQAGERATFTGPGGLSNVIARVTGGAPSAIDGLLRSEVPGANLFLINPWGIAFGPNAALLVDGSFHASTADYLRFADGARFDARTPAQSVLTSAPPAAFGFLSDRPAPISLAGARAHLPALPGDVAIQAGPGGDLTFSAGEVVLSNGTSSDGVAGGTWLHSNGGRIAIDGVSSRGELALAGSGAVDSVALGGAVLMTGDAAITQTDGRGISIRGGQIVFEQRASIEVATEAAPAAGAVDIRGDSFVLRDAASIKGLASGAVPGAPIAIAVRDTLSLQGSRDPVAGRSALGSATEGSGPSGTITLNAARILIGDASVVGFAYGAGAVGDIVVRADDRVVLSGDGSIVVQLHPGSTGSGGALAVGGAHIEMADNAYIATSNAGGGQGARVALSAGRSIRMADGSYVIASGLDRGAAGSVSLQAPEVTLQGGSISGLAGGAADAGDIEIRATSSLRITGGTGVGSTTNGAGRGGRIVVVAPAVVLDATIISAESYEPLPGEPGSGASGSVRIEGDSVRIVGGTKISASTSSAGPAGEVTVIARDLEVSGPGSVVSSVSFGTGSGGSIDFAASERLAVSDGATVSAGTAGPGNAGVVSLRSGGVLDVNGSSAIRNSTRGSGNAGTIVLAAPQIRIASSSISSASQVDADGGQAIGQGGAVTITGGTLSFTDAAINSSTLTDGRAGDITLRGASASISGGQISASTIAGGPAGAVLIQVDGLLDFSDRAGISSATFRDGRGGAVELSAGRISLRSGATVAANSDGSGQAGNLTLSARDGIRLTDASIETGSASATSGGNVTLLTPALVVLQRSRVMASAFGGGDGGNIVIDPRFVVLQGGSRIEANAVNGS